MSERVTFIHSGDLHFGAPFRGLRALSDAWAERLSRAIPEAYDRLIDACIDRQVDFLLLAGDEFDTDKPSYAHFRRFIEGLERLDAAGIAVYMITGNHDPYSTWRDLLPSLPPNARMFGVDAPEFAVHTRDGEPVAIVCGRGFSTHPGPGGMAAGINRREAFAACGMETPFVVGMLHTGLWMDPYKAPTSEVELVASELDYWALGHIHMRYEPTGGADPRFAFCGCIQGRDIKETGDRGCYAVTLEEGLPNKIEFIPTASVEWERLVVDVSACAGVEDILTACVSEMFDANSRAACEEMVARVTLRGATPLHDMLERPGFMEEMRTELNDRYPSFFCDALVDETRRPLDREALAADGLFPVALMKAAAAQRADTEMMERLMQTEFANRGLSLPRNVEGRLEKISRDAEDLVFDMLFDDGGSQ